jgi:hypothetical protein
MRVRIKFYGMDNIRVLLENELKGYVENGGSGQIKE